jgi:hypothetical protein
VCNIILAEMLASKPRAKMNTVTNMKKSMEVLAKNLARLLRSQRISPHKFAASSKAGSTTISTILSPDREPNYSCTLKKVDEIANHFGLEGWQLLVDLPDECLRSPDSVREATKIKANKPDLALLGRSLTELNAVLDELDVSLSEDKYDLLLERVYEDAISRNRVDHGNVVSLVRLVAA